MDVKEKTGTLTPIVAATGLSPASATPIINLYGVGKVKAAAYQKMHIETLADLIRLYPRAYEDRGDIRLLSTAREDGKSAVVLTVATAPHLTRLRSHKTFLKFRAYDDSGTCEITYFNQDYLRSAFFPGDTYRFWGKVERSGARFVMTSPVAEPWTENIPLPSLVSVYRTTEGLSQKQIALHVQAALQVVLPELEDVLPETVREKNGLCTLSYALRQIHAPESIDALARAKRRLTFDELFYFAVGMGLAGGLKQNAALSAPACTVTGLEELKAQLPFALTRAQERVINEILGDMAHPYPMSRMLVGDVGCGKTVCAAAAIVCAVRSGYQAALMVPTEILARQHFADLSPLFDKLGIKTALLVGADTPSRKKAVRESLADSDPTKRPDVVIGTQALLSDGVNFAAPALVITDEQHRFGVHQRAVLSGKNGYAHLLAMSATPIPRTLALVLYGDLAISRIDEMPPGRQRVNTYLVGEEYRERLNAFIRKQVQAGGQVYIVCPAVEESEEAPDEVELDVVGFADLHPERAPLKAAVTYAAELQAALPELSVAFVHGKMKTAEKEAVMNDFAAGKTQVLVSTTVIEVGVNVPNATLMIVENAERFGLSQLHQLRGRVGRGSRQSYCVLVSDDHGKTATERLHTMTNTYDGYSIAEQDLAQRGPGDFLSPGNGAIRQSGKVEFKMASLCHDSDVMTDAFTAARTLLDADNTLSSYPRLREEVSVFFSDSMGMLN